MSISKSIYPAKHIQMWRSSLISLLCMPFCFFSVEGACYCLRLHRSYNWPCCFLWWVAHTLSDPYHVSPQFWNTKQYFSKFKEEIIFHKRYAFSAHSPFPGPLKLDCYSIDPQLKCCPNAGRGADSESTLDVLNTALLLFLLSMPNAITTSTDSTRS